ncbi:MULTISPECIES: peptide deformylase [Anaerococcus]|jgi:peptide deformylase|uniref:Peptide deformylase n=1 Tax=Anaerococcus octavius TaxID=54007 RepID=A0A2I1M6R7_9FIRM|nr:MULTISPECIES: peptide deformylase [Anaerococcus]MBS6106145.1 peptide deformylase [Anaerococcus sp.]MDU2599560.1 peptide deformylase [Anaerococcus sp.]MDU3177689.1 peptide deformylase [Anaerococcus sp.]MDU4025714.1 peptide deformylase [Anaerococcus sp.]MDU5229736.1 peptide deformylase [Anaerococcus sp.]
MAIRNIRIEGDPILRKECREVPKVTERIKVLLDDMGETMYQADGVGLAAPQVGILKRVIVVDPHDEVTGLVKLINPEIIEADGEQVGVEGCLSIPNFNATVKRPEHVKVKYLDENGKEQIWDAHGFPAVILSHEIDHLNGVLFRDKYIEEISYEVENA